MNKLFLIVFSSMLLAFIGCSADDDLVKSKEFIYNFKTDSEGWVGDFADYPNQPNVESFYEFEFAHSNLPNPLNTTEGALKQSGNNHSDDLFMFVKKKITGLESNKEYKIGIEIEIATNAPSGAVGVGGAPGEGVIIKAGASTIEPLKVLNSTDNYYRMNIDKGDQGTDGISMQLIGDFANGTTLNKYTLKNLKTGNPISVQSNSNGEIWVIVGTDSGYEATTTIYYNSIKVNLN